VRKKLAIVFVAVASALIALGASPTTNSKPSTKKTKPKGATIKAKGATVPSKKPTTAGKSVSAKNAAKKSPSKTSTKQTATTSTRYRRTTQKQPSPERYQEIQQALADKGFFKGNVDGTWGPDSVEALKSFQRNQNIGDDGKLGSMSLIALGLGPKRDGQSSLPGEPASPPGETSRPTSAEPTSQPE